MDYLEFLFAGFAVFWAGLVIYLLWLQASLHAVKRELERLEERLAERDDRATAAAPGKTPVTARPIRRSDDGTEGEREGVNG